MMNREEQLRQNWLPTIKRGTRVELVYSSGREQAIALGPIESDEYGSRFLRARNAKGIERRPGLYNVACPRGKWTGPASLADALRAAIARKQAELAKLERELAREE